MLDLERLVKEIAAKIWRQNLGWVQEEIAAALRKAGINSNLIDGSHVRGTLPIGVLPDHHTLHEDGGSQEIDVTGLSGLLADPQTPLAHTLDSHSDVDAASPTDGQALIYDEATDTWIPGDVASTVDLSAYQLRSEKGSPNGYAGLGANSLVPTVQLGSGTASADTYLAGDQTYKSITFPTLHVHVWQEDLSAGCNGATTNFHTAQAFDGGSTLVWLNGLLQRPGAGNDYEEDADHAGITFTTAPLSGDVLIVAYVVGEALTTITLSGPYDASYGARATLVLCQLHCHTDDSTDDGVNTPAEVVGFYVAAGYGALTITGHDLVTVQPAGVTTGITGSELSPATGHILSINSDYARSGETDRQTLIDAIVADGGQAVIAHPKWYVGMTYAQMAALTDYLGVEIHNALCVGGAGGYSPATYPGFAVAEWDALLSNVRQDIWGFAHDDFHGESWLAGYDVGRLVVFVSSNTLNNLMDSLVKGCFVADVSNFGVTPGYPTYAGGTIAVTCPGATSIRFLGASGLLQEDTGDTGSYMPDGSEKYVRIEAVGDYTEGFDSAIDTANRWGINSGTWAVSGSKLRQTDATTGPHIALLKRHICGDLEMTCEITMNSEASAAQAGLLFNCLDAGNTYFLQVQAGNDAFQGFNLWKWVGGGSTCLQQHSMTIAGTGTSYSVRLRYIQATGQIKARIWATGSAEPGVWHLDVSDTSLQRGGAIAFRTRYAADFDNLHIRGFKTYYQPIKVVLS